MKFSKTDIVVSIAAVLLLAAFVATGFRFSAVRTWVCPVCGARKQQTRWVFGFKSAPIVEDSPLALTLLHRGRAYEHKWQSLHRTGRNLFGRPISAGSSGHPPPISFARPAQIEQFLQSASESEVEEFVRLMLSGSEDEQVPFFLQNELAHWDSSSQAEDSKRGTRSRKGQATMSSRAEGGRLHPDERRSLTTSAMRRRGAGRPVQVSNCAAAWLTNQSKPDAVTQPILRASRSNAVSIGL